ncbi:MAG: hypothetical protein V3T70_03665, partial [Phycisphaerae bacterium]
MRPRTVMVAIIGAALTAIILTHAFDAVAQNAAETPASQPARDDALSGMGISVTGGAAPGYVPDRTCAMCHSKLFRSFQDVGMSRSFYEASAKVAVEDFENNHFFHAPSGRHYEMHLKDGRYVFRRYQLDDDGKTINNFEQEIDWIMGSGSRVRSYLYRTPADDLFLLPVAWYGQTRRWGMSPAFDRPTHKGVRRPITRECMFCHNAYPDVPVDSDVYGAPHTYPAELPQGIGCQRCHGPGAEHVRVSMSVDNDLESMRDSIINPGRFDRRRQNEVCYQCHMQPTVALLGVRRFGRGDYSFRPDQRLADYLVFMDVEVSGEKPSERFEINHHAYRMEQSKCFTAGGGRLGCLTCHDPHRKVREAERASHYRAACLTCHELNAHPALAAGRQAAPSGSPDDVRANERGGAPNLDDCVSCHMPQRRPQDVVHVASVTDHRIQRRPGGSELLAPLEEEDLFLDQIELAENERAPRGALGQVYRAVGAMRFGDVSAVGRLARMLAAAPTPEIDPYLD